MCVCNQLYLSSYISTPTTCRSTGSSRRPAGVSWPEQCPHSLVECSAFILFWSGTFFPAVYMRPHWPWLLHYFYSLSTSCHVEASLGHLCLRAIMKTLETTLADNIWNTAIVAVLSASQNCRVQLTPHWSATNPPAETWGNAMRHFRVFVE